MTNSSKIKVYQEVLDQIRMFIETNSLKEGDRLPSERELAEQLNASRSSVREALRAIELLGLIETKHGEGTFLKTYRPYHTVELLATFVLRQPTTKNELLEVRLMLEEQCITRCVNQVSHEKLIEIVNSLYKVKGDFHSYVFSELFEQVGNDLLYKIWHLINNFSQTTYSQLQDQELYGQLMTHIKNKELEEALNVLKILYDQKTLN
ncbi:FadR/GntR family transcriptional regulator [Piscibacillus sp. B03]|uniref:FadR/GntR family transcriptional regulator n=1 Tax=Piscibacillus sp. B03 TaxID=3457430 RepID=UPI003FCDE7C1